MARPSLAEGLKRVAAGASPAEPAPSATTPPVPQDTPAPPSTPAERRPTEFYAATRVGKKKVTATLDPAAHRQLKHLATDKGVTTEALLNEAISDLFAKHGLPRVA